MQEEFKDAVIAEIMQAVAVGEDEMVNLPEAEDEGKRAAERGEVIREKRMVKVEAEVGQIVQCRRVEVTAKKLLLSKPSIATVASTRITLGLRRML